MATKAVTPKAPEATSQENNNATATVTNNDMAVKSQNVVWERWDKVTYSSDDPSKVVDVKVTLIQEPTTEKLEKAAKDGFTVKRFSQVVRTDEAGTTAGCALIVYDEAERLVIWNRGLDAKRNQKLNSLFRDTDENGNPVFQPQDDPYDPTELLNVETQRRNLSPIDKARKGMEKAGIPQAQIDAAIAAIIAAQAVVV